MREWTDCGVTPQARSSGGIAGQAREQHKLRPADIPLPSLPPTLTDPSCLPENTLRCERAVPFSGSRGPGLGQQRLEPRGVARSRAGSIPSALDSRVRGGARLSTVLGAPRELFRSRN